MISQITFDNKNIWIQSKIKIKKLCLINNLNQLLQKAHCSNAVIVSKNLNIAYNSGSLF
jgi:hypothetical protein